MEEVQIPHALCERLMGYLVVRADTDEEARSLLEQLKEEREIIYSNRPKDLKEKASLRTTAPANYWLYHHPGCGTDYRGCHPTKCPKNEYEKTGIWQQALVEKINIY